MDPLLLTIIILAVIFFFVLSSIRVVQQYERGVIFTLGRLVGAKGPGLFLVVPFISRMIKVDLRIATHIVPPQEVITRDNITIKVTAVLYFLCRESCNCGYQRCEFHSSDNADWANNIA